MGKDLGTKILLLVLTGIFGALLSVVGWVAVQVYEQSQAVARLEANQRAILQNVDMVWTGPVPYEPRFDEERPTP